MSDKPTFVSRDTMTADEGYVQWMTDIKQRFRQSQIKATVRVNTAMLDFIGAWVVIWWHFALKNAGAQVW